MIHIEPIPDDLPPDPLPVASGPAWIGTVSFGGCLSIGFFVMLLPAIGILRNFGITPLQSLPILLLAAAVISAITIWRGNVYSRKLDERWKRRTEATLAGTQAAARRYGYVPQSEGGALRHRVTITHIEAIWSVEDISFDGSGPNQIVRTSQNEYVYFCAGESTAEFEDFADGVFYLKETITLELGGNLTYVEGVEMTGRRIPVRHDEVPARSLPDGLLAVGFAILDDPDVIHRLPPILTSGAGASD